MKKLLYLLLAGIFLSLNLFATPATLLDIDFTRDSTTWKPLFPAPAFNSDSSAFFIPIDNYVAEDFKFGGQWGKFQATTSYKAQPMYIEDNNKYRRWAFKLGTSSDSYIELPELASVGRFTVFSKNASSTSETSMYLQRRNGENWETIRTIYLPPHQNQNFELQVEEFVNINKPVKLRILGATIGIHVYQIRVDAYDAEIPKEKPLKLIIIPDAQTYANRETLNHIYGYITTWVNSIADDVKFILQQGDITQLNDNTQWKIAAGAFNLFEGRKIPFTFCAGNHDMGRNGSSRNTNLMNSYLPYSRYSRNEWFGGTFEPNTVDNTWHTFAYGDYKFLIISLEYLPRDKVLDWANMVISAHPKHNVIINTHSYLRANNTLNTGVPQEGLRTTGEETPNNGDDIWEKCVKKHKNCLFVFSGHILSDGNGYRVSKGDNGNTVYQFLANYQGGVDGSQDSRNGMIRIMDIEPENKRFSIQTYSPYQNKYNTNIDQDYYYTNVDFIKDGEPEIYKPEPADLISEDFSSKSWESELERLNPGGGINPNAPNPNAYYTPDVEGKNAYFNLNSTDPYFFKYHLSGEIESLPVLPCAAVENITHENDGLAVAFRFTNNASGLIELPELPNAGIITLHVRNGNLNNSTSLALEKFTDDHWTVINVFNLHPHGALRTSRDEIINYDVNTNEPIKLQVRNAGSRYINLYRISVGSYNGITPTNISPSVNPIVQPSFKLIGRKLTLQGPSTIIRIYNLSGRMVFNRFVDHETYLPESMGNGLFIIHTNTDIRKVFLN